MKQVIVIGLLAATALATTGDYEAMFKAFKATHKKTYANEAEEAKRFKAFVENMKKAEVLQAANPHATFGVNVYADQTAAEFKGHHNGEAYFRAAAKRPKKLHISTAAERQATVGQAIDWRAKGAVTGVKNQGICEAGWAFSTTGNIEGQWFLAGNPLTSLSSQELLDCDSIADGCGGGLIADAFSWIVNYQQGIIVTEAAYPFVSGSSGVNEQCNTGPLNLLSIGANITSFVDIQTSEDAIAAYCLANGPVSVHVDSSSFQTYTGGVLTNCISQQVDHGVLIVGFDDTAVPPYWIVKNSWGTGWGESGYIRIAKGSNQCLINTMPSSSVVGGNSTITLK